MRVTCRGACVLTRAYRARYIRTTAERTNLVKGQYIFADEGKTQINPIFTSEPRAAASVIARSSAAYMYASRRAAMKLARVQPLLRNVKRFN